MRWSGDTEGKVCPGEREKYERKATDKRERGENTHQLQDSGVRQSIGKLKWHF